MQLVVPKVPLNPNQPAFLFMLAAAEVPALTGSSSGAGFVYLKVDRRPLSVKRARTRYKAPFGR